MGAPCRGKQHDQVAENNDKFAGFYLNTFISLFKSQNRVFDGPNYTIEHLGLCPEEYLKETQDFHDGQNRENF